MFRKMSKVQSHEMKETLYSNLVQADLVRAFIQRHILTTWWHLVNITNLFVSSGGATEAEENHSRSR